MVVKIMHRKHLTQHLHKSKPSKDMNSCMITDIVIHLPLTQQSHFFAPIYSKTPFKKLPTLTNFISHCAFFHICILFALTIVLGMRPVCLPLS